MNKILDEVRTIIREGIKEYLPNVNPNDLEENGMVYYMNGQNGTEFEWHVNEHLPYFMAFYNDKQNLGVAKLSILKNGKVKLYLYGEHGKKLAKEIDTSIDTTEDELFKLAVVLKNEADDKRIWDASIERINSDINPSNEQIQSFIKGEEYTAPTKNRAKMLDKMAYLSKKVLDENWKVGYMYRSEPLNEQDSGWAFMAGNEDDEYNNDSKNIALVSIGEISQLDPDILKYIDNPVGTNLIRISPTEFEIDKNDKEIFMMRRG